MATTEAASYSTDDIVLDRKSQDNNINWYGKSLIDMCGTLDYYIVHGRFIPVAMTGSMTFLETYMAA